MVTSAPFNPQSLRDLQRFESEIRLGMAAYADEKNAETNPFPAGSDQALAWRHGWNLALYKDGE